MNIGEKLRRLRLQRNLTQEEMADRCELSKGFISQVERDLASPSIATLTDMLESLGSNLQEFFSEQPDEKIVFSREDMFVKQDDESLQGSITWLIPSAQKNAMEPILVELGEHGLTQEMPPHEGDAPDASQDESPADEPQDEPNEETPPDEPKDEPSGEESK